jgi:hypothetical protein
MRYLLPFILLIAASQAQAKYLGCTPDGSVEWREGTPAAFAFDPEEEFGPVLFGIDLESGKYLEHLVGGRAGISGGGTVEIIEPGDIAARDDFIGRDRHSYFRIMIWRDPMSFIRIHDDGLWMSVPASRHPN